MVGTRLLASSSAGLGGGLLGRFVCHYGVCVRASVRMCVGGGGGGGVRACVSVCVCFLCCSTLKRLTYTIRS